MTAPMRLNDSVSAPLLGSSRANAPGAGGGAGSSVASNRSAGSGSKCCARNAGPGCRRDRRLRMLAEEPFAYCAPMRQGGAGVGRGHRPDLGVERGDAATPVGEPQAIGRRAVALRPVERVGHSGSGSIAPQRAEQHDRPDHDQDHRPELAPADRRKVDPQRALEEEPHADAQDEQADDERPDTTRIAAISSSRRRPGRHGWRGRRHVRPASDRVGSGPARAPTGAVRRRPPRWRRATGWGRGSWGSGSRRPSGPSV